MQWSRTSTRICNMFAKHRIISFEKQLRCTGCANINVIFSYSDTDHKIRNLRELANCLFWND